MDRLSVLSRQLTSESAGLLLDVDSTSLERLLAHDNYDLRKAIFAFLQEPIYAPQHGLSLLEFRELTLQRLKAFVSRRFFSVTDYLADPRRFMAALECLSYCDYSLAIKAGVHFTLCGGTICKLGNTQQHAQFLPGIDNLTLPGCFGMTELGHGSNVMGIETTAGYDAASQEFVINTPNDDASKFWIGGSGQHGKVCAVFAQLVVAGVWQGPHVFVVRIRDDQGCVMPNVRIEDHGAKMGLNGVDNGRIWFSQTRVPRTHMLDKYASVSPEGVYSSSIPSVSARFGVTVGGLTTGRVLIATAAVDAAKIGLTIAIRYGLMRPQFGERSIMEYVTHQERLLPALAQTYALHCALGALKDVYVRGQAVDAKTIHVLSSGLKAAATWGRVEALQHARECCGGMGFLSANKIGPMLTDMNVDVTFEGDNTVLMQQVAKSLVDEAMQAMGNAAPSPALQPPGGVSDTLSSAAASAAQSSPKLLPLISQLLRWREVMLVQQVASAMAAAATAAQASGRAAAAQAAFDAHLDTVVSIGWAHVERFCFDTLVRVGTAAAGGPAVSQPLLLMARLYGLTRVQRSAAEYLAAGALRGQDVGPLRTCVHACYASLMAAHGRPALALCDAWGIPDHLVAAPIAFNWHQV